MMVILTALPVARSQVLVGIPDQGSSVVLLPRAFAVFASSRSQILDIRESRTVMIKTRRYQPV